MVKKEYEKKYSGCLERGNYVNKPDEEEVKGNLGTTNQKK